MEQVSSVMKSEPQIQNGWVGGRLRDKLSAPDKTGGLVGRSPLSPTIQKLLREPSWALLPTGSYNGKD